jgi:hypothetical protein
MIRHVYQVTPDGSQVQKLKLIPKSKQSVDSLLDGYHYCRKGTHFYSLIETALTKLYGGKLPDPDAEPVWKVVEIMDLPYNVDRQLYQPGPDGELLPMADPTVQGDGIYAWHSF